jgi:hypothetical protein
VEKFSFPKSFSFQKLSELQKFILVALTETRYAAARPREFSAAIRRLYWERGDTPSTRKSLSRALRRLEQRGYIMRLDRHWQLTCTNPFDNGVIMAVMAWAQRRELYVQKMGFQGAFHLLPKTNSAAPAQMETKNESLSQTEQAPQPRPKERLGVKTPLDPD